MSKTKHSIPRYNGSTVSINGTGSVAKLILVISNLFKLVHSLPIHATGSSTGVEASKETELTPNEYWTNLFISMMLVLLGGVFAGLTLGLMGQDEVYLKVISTSGDKNERKYAQKVLRLIGRGKHWVLVTLLLSNVITNETLPIVLDRCLGGGWPAVVTSTVSIVIFGEIIPQSICVRYGLQVGALFAPFVLMLMYIMYPVAYPCALLLDHILGEDHGTVYKKSGLKTLVTLHKTMGVERLNQDEVTIISAVLDLKEKSVSTIMTPMDRVYTMSADTLLDEKTVEEIFNAGFSRIPIHLPNEPNNFIGMLLVRVLISYDPEDALPVASFPLATLPETGVDTSCLNILNYFQEGKSHMIIVSETPGEATGALGVLTLEDVIEELIGEEIVDESDVYVDINKNIKRKHPGPLSKRNLTSYLHNLYQRGGSAAASKRNSLESSERPDLKERLSGTGSLEAKLISYTPNHRNHKNENGELSTSQKGNSLTGNNGTGASANSAVATAAAAGGGGGGVSGGSKFKIKNPALNPLETSKSFVHIKRPDQGTIHSVAKAASPAPIHPETTGEHLSPHKTGELYPTEHGAINEAKRRSVELNSPTPKMLDLSKDNAKELKEEEGKQGGKDEQEEVDVTDHHRHDHHDDGHIDIPVGNRSFNNGGNGFLDLERQESRSYRTGGIIESVVNVDGVHKTIIENVSDGDLELENGEDDLVIDDAMLHREQNKRNKKKKSTSTGGRKRKSRQGSTSSRSNSFSMNKFSDEDEEEHQSLLNGHSNGDVGSLHSSVSSSITGNGAGRR